MANQKMGGCKKRRRVKLIREQRELICGRHHATRQRRHKKYGHSYTRTYGGHPMFPKVVNDEVGKTFDDEYKTYKKTRGRRGLCPNPLKRKAENMVYLARNSVFNVQKVPMIELMERAILAHEGSRM